MCPGPSRSTKYQSAALPLGDPPPPPPPRRCGLSRAQESAEEGVQAHPGSLSQVSPVSGPFPGVSSPEGPGSLANCTCLSPGKLALDEGGSDTESLYEIAGLNKVIQFM